MADDAEDVLLWGVDEITLEIGRSRRQTYHLLETGALPVARKVGGRWVASRRTLWAFFRGETA